MITSLETAEKYIIGVDAEELELRMEAVELFICRYTHNNFIPRGKTAPEYSADVVMGALELVKWDVANREKAGVASETISSHSWSYFDQSASNYTAGYPAMLLGFLKPYMKARF